MPALNFEEANDRRSQTLIISSYAGSLLRQSLRLKAGTSAGARAWRVGGRLGSLGVGGGGGGGGMIFVAT
jgi:hypothetical protein